MSMSIRAMQCFVAVVSTGSISRAAAALHVAQPALSLLIRNLEEDLGVVLLHRSARGVTPTAAGSRMLAHAREILGRIDAARADVREDISAPRGTVSLAMSMSMAKLLTVPLLRFSLEHWPGVYLKIIESSTGYIPGFVSSGHADLGLTFSDDASVDLRFQHLIDEELVVVSPPPAKSRKKPAPAALHALPAMDLHALAELPLVLPGSQHSLRRLLDHYQQQERAEFRVIAEANAIPQLIELAQAGIAHTILSYAAVHQEAARGEVLLHRIVKPRLARPVFLCRSDVLPLSMAASAVADRVSRIITDSRPGDPPTRARLR
ncbi:LysR family transcriptional regulator [Achromobacter sp. K91]|jgi:DNA-binding transcriptional LysR family regulator|uniref:Cyn operon transcriptional activator n=1 Tax=Achromobacter aegrifaciens TaxID=1287736 RepID=A0AAD2J1M7_ACHAE|nr:MULTISPECIES: LysR substrate-binding domain-containing protein [Achromobacter]PTN49424.1 LysR family transcriptional regulator [Achromobacter xylosoxidans]MBD9419275.1 LysR family transcriptional regulator [Achromobacter sp. ACM04]MBD9429666.1 LysR family transcriptional regulator [Achromobacter sp. ACM03]MBD9475911.1 LysR family transcriptional regulator [Achromobacter sp. ACM01]MDQ1762562.1 LysR substrate-binding domain-containing protein [Achromobacter aegrifaciens]